VVTPVHAIKGPASAGPFRVAVALVVLALLLTGCKSGKAPIEESETLDERLGAAPAIIDPSSTTLPGDPATSTSAPGGGGATSTTRRPSTGGTSPGGGPTTTIPPVPFRPLASVTDRTGDAGLEAPPYDDFTSLRVEENGSHARFTVEFAANMPPVLADGEVMGIGIDVYRGGRESDYQVFADGSDEGWLAYLHVGRNFVRYEGTFELGANRLVFTVPWSAIGGRQAGEVAAFADWSQEGTLLNKAGQDKAPDRTKAAFTP
jgi:hypothetical protein